MDSQDKAASPTGHGLVVAVSVATLFDELVAALRTEQFLLRLRGEPRRPWFLPDSPGAEQCGEVPVSVRGWFSVGHSIVEILPFDREWSEVSIRNGKSGELPCCGALYDRSWSSLEQVLVMVGLRSGAAAQAPSPRAVASHPARGGRRAQPTRQPSHGKPTF